MTSAVTSRARLHRFAEVHNGPITKIPYVYVRLNTHTFHVRGFRFRTGQIIITAVEEFVRRLLQDTVDGILRLPDVWRPVLHVEGDYI